MRPAGAAVNGVARMIQINATFRPMESYWTAIKPRQNSNREGHAPMPNAKDATDRAEEAMAQIARLREQVESLIRDRVGPAMEDAAERAGAAAAVMRDRAEEFVRERAGEFARGRAGEVVRERADELAGAVRHQPLTAILVAAAVGFLLGRVSR